jgi:DNA-binding NtrC family response regulator
MLGTQKLGIPPLCEHKKYIPSLMEHFVDIMSKIIHTPIKEFSMDATNKLLKYDYPGNSTIGIILHLYHAVLRLTKVLGLSQQLELLAK